MPEEREIEKLLRSYGKQRQDKAPEGLHPATRRLLLGEVARQFPQGGASRAGGKVRWWRQFAWVGGLCAVLVVGVYRTVYRPPQSASLAKSEPTSAPAAAGRPAIDAAISDSPVDRGAVRREVEVTIVPTAEHPVIEYKEGSAGARALLRPEDYVPQEVLAAPLQVVPSLVAQNEEARSALSDQTKLAADKKNDQLAAPAASPALSTLGAAGNTPARPEVRDVVMLRQEAVAESSPAAVSARFTQQDASSAPLFTNQIGANESRSFSAAPLRRSRATAAAATVGPPLQVFRFVQSSNGVQLIDRDGSVYTGSFEALPETAGLAGASAVPSRAFQVMGTNSTTGERVSIQGWAQFDSYAKALPAVPATSTSTLRTQPVLTGAPRISAPTNAAPTKVEAKAIWSDGRQTEIRAVRADK